MTPQEQKELRELRDFWFAPVDLGDGVDRRRADRLDDFLKYWTVPAKPGKRPRMDRVDTFLDVFAAGNLIGKIAFGLIVGLGSLAAAWVAIKSGVAEVFGGGRDG